MRVAVTGGAGFIGANLVRDLADDSGNDVVVDDLSTGTRENLDGVDVTFLEGTILNPDFLDVAFSGVDAVVHLAARPSVPRSIKNPIATHHANVTGTVEVLEAARRAGGPYVIVASSSSLYGANPSLPKHEDLAPAPLSPYAASKLATEAYALAYQASYGLPVLAVRLFNVFGPLQPAGHAYAAAIPAFVDATLNGGPVTIHGDGRQTRDFTYVGSVVRILTEALRGRVTSPAPVNLAFGSRRSLLEVIAALEQVLATDIEVVHTRPRPGDVRHSQADGTRLRHLFPDVAPVGFDEGLASTVAWFKQRTPMVVAV